MGIKDKVKDVAKKTENVAKDMAKEAIIKC
jgi:hypothetical protein